MDVSILLTGVTVYVAAFWGVAFLVAYRDRLFGMAPLSWPRCVDSVEDDGSTTDEPVIFPFWLWAAALPVLLILGIFLCWPFLLWLVGRAALTRLRTSGFARMFSGLEGRRGRSSASTSAQGT